MAFKIYNTLSREKELFKPIKKGHVNMYICGPTVYNFPHIGNYRAYVAGDLLNRYLKYLGYKVKFVQNLTDVDDKTIRDSQKQKVSLQKFTQPFIDGFFQDLKTLNILPADVYPRATEHIKDMVDTIKKLQENGLAYKVDKGDIYFSINKFNEYGKLAHLNKEQLKSGASGRVSADEYDKENPRDFALWKAWTEEDGDVFWETELGKGRPGWHIECSSMSVKYLGQPFDIHGGGVDLIFPHHENEIAQAEGAEKKKFVNYWFHNEWLLVESQKMSKSAGNFYNLRHILDKGYHPLAVRYLLLATHYRQQLNFTFDALKGARSSLQRIWDFMKKLDECDSSENSEKVQPIIDKAVKLFEDNLNNDLEISGALSAVFDLIKEINILMDFLSKEDAVKIKKVMESFDSVLGFIVNKEDDVSDEIKALIDQREKARKQKDFKKADEIRDELKKQGIVLEDTPKGVRWKKV
ncbi:cysteine--tRNA ligase [Candidatus Woesearchaeota archaeon]|nr:cysteine--tRNA ligase [Candidatus Woesearchaeota archaeon]